MWGDPPYLGKMQIFPMKLEDLPQVAKLAGQLGYPTTLDDVRSRFEAMVRDPEMALFVARDERNHVLGWTHVRLEPKSLLHGVCVEVAALVVDENYRGQGVGQKLLREGEAWARHRGFREIRLRSNVKRQDAARFYLREGYEISKQSNVFAKNLG